MRNDQFAGMKKNSKPCNLQPCIPPSISPQSKIPTNMSMPPLEDPHGHHHLPPGTTEDDIAAAAAAAVPSALNRKCGNPTCNDWALRGRGELRFVSVFSCSALVCVAFGDTTPMVGYGTMFIFVFFFSRPLHPLVGRTRIKIIIYSFL